MSLERRWVLAGQADGRSGLKGKQRSEGWGPLPSGLLALLSFPCRCPDWQEVAGTCWGLAGRFQKCLGYGLGVWQELQVQGPASLLRTLCRAEVSLLR